MLNPSVTTRDDEMRSKCHRPFGFEHQMAAPALLLLHDATCGIASLSRLGATIWCSERGQSQFFSRLLDRPLLTRSSAGRTLSVTA